MFLLKIDRELKAVAKGRHTVWQAEKWKGGRGPGGLRLSSPRIKSHLHMKSYWHNAPSTSCCSPGRYMHKRLSVLNTAKWDVPLAPPTAKKIYISPS